MRFVQKPHACRSVRAYDSKGTQVSGYCKQSGRRCSQCDMPGAIPEPMTATERRHPGSAKKERRDFITKSRVCRRTVAYDCSDCDEVGGGGDCYSSRLSRKKTGRDHVRFRAGFRGFLLLILALHNRFGDPCRTDPLCVHSRASPYC